MSAGGEPEGENGDCSTNPERDASLADPANRQRAEAYEESREKGETGHRVSLPGGVRRTTYAQHTFLSRVVSGCISPPYDSLARWSSTRRFIVVSTLGGRPEPIHAPTKRAHRLLTLITIRS